MKNSKTMMRLAVFVLCAALLTPAVMASSGVKTLTAYYMNIKLVVDGTAVTPRDANGTAVEPFACDGTTYLPVRAVASALGKDVSWDGDTKTVYIGKAPGESSYIQPYQVSTYSSAFDGTDASKYFSVMGVKYTNGVSPMSSYYCDYALYNTNGQYSTLSFTCGHVDGGSSGKGTLNVYADGKSIYELALSGDMQAQAVTLNISSALQLKFAVTGGGYYDAGDYAIANVSVK